MSFISSSYPISCSVQPTTDNQFNGNNHTNSLAEIKAEITNGINTVAENLNNGFSGDLATLETVLQLLNHSSITEDNIKIMNKQAINNKNCYTVLLEDNKLFSITIITGETRFPTATTSGDNVTITLKQGFDELYNQIYAPNYDVISETELDNNASNVVA